MRRASADLTLATARRATGTEGIHCGPGTTALSEMPLTLVVSVESRAGSEAGVTSATSRYPPFGIVSMKRGCFGSSPNARRSSEMARVSTSSVTNVPGQTLRSRRSLELSLLGCSARHTNTCMTLGSRRTVLSGLDRLFKVGSTSQSPTRKADTVQATRCVEHFRRGAGALRAVAV